MQMRVHPRMCARCTQLFLFCKWNKTQNLYFPLLVLYSSACALSEWRSFSFHFSYQCILAFSIFHPILPLIFSEWKWVRPDLCRPPPQKTSRERLHVAQQRLFSLCDLTEVFKNGFGGLL